MRGQTGGSHRQQALITQQLDPSTHTYVQFPVTLHTEPQFKKAHKPLRSVKTVRVKGLCVQLELNLEICMYGISYIKVRDHNSVLPYISTTQHFHFVAEIFKSSKSSIVPREENRRSKVSFK